MPKQIIINAAPWETRVALVEDNVLVELHIERRSARSLAGSLYKGRVQRVLPGMQAAFCEIGLEKAAFLHASDLVWPRPTDESGAEPGADDAALAADDGPALPAAPSTDTEPNGEPEPGVDEVPLDVAVDHPPGEELAPAEAAGDEEAPPRPKRALVPIQERLHKGDDLLLQISKEPIGTKGARVTAHVSLPGRYLVYMPSTRHVGISRRIENGAERDRLRALVEAHRPPEGGFIVRTACEGVTDQEIEDDIKYLTKVWARIQQKFRTANAPARLHQDLDLALRSIRDLFTGEVDKLVIDDAACLERAHDFVEGLMPHLLDRLQLHDSPTPIFDTYGIEQKITRALDRRVWLKSGGYLIFDQTESLTTVDVNTGRYVGKQDQEETVLKTNLEAAKAVVQQLRLRNIGGIIVIDFIDMESAEHRQQVYDALQEAARGDKARSNMLQISELGLVQMTRKRTRESLGQLLNDPCPHCHGNGRLRSVQTLAYDTLREIQRRTAGMPPGAKRVRVQVHPEVAAWLLDREQKSINALRDGLGVPVFVDVGADTPEGEVTVTIERP